MFVMLERRSGINFVTNLWRMLKLRMTKNASNTLYLRYIIYHFLAQRLSMHDLV